MSKKGRQGRFSDDEMKDLLKIFSKQGGNITKTSKLFAEKHKIEYDDNLRRVISYNLKVRGKTDNARNIEDSDTFKEAQKRKLSKSKIYFITYAQNATPVKENFFNNVLTYKELHKAELSVILGRYKNPTSTWSENQENDEWWAEAVLPFSDANRHDLHRYLTIASDIKIQPTAVNPLTGLEHISFDKTCVVGHPKLHMKPIPVLEGHPKKVLMTTGACTQPNYTDSKAGKKAESHHKYGFVVVEIKNNKIFFIRQVEADKDGNFHDLIYKVFDGKVTIEKECPAVVMGDIHHRYLDEEVDKETERFFEYLKPRELVLHDVLDGDSINHHEAKNPFKVFERHVEGRNILATELNELKSWIKDKLKYNPVVVRSNHDEWIDKWLASKDWKLDIPNSIEYMQYALILLQGKAPKGILPYILEEEFNDDIICLDVNDSYKVLGFEIGNHGYYGQSGSKGSIIQFRRLNTKVIVGDYHSPSRYDDAIGVGVSCQLRLPYNVGASGWLHCHAIIHENNTAQQIIFIEGEFTTMF